MSLNDVNILSKNPDNREIANELVEILQNLIRIPSKSGNEYEIAQYLKNFGSSVPNWTVINDDINNVYFVPNYSKDEILPLLIAHSDTKHESSSLRNVVLKGKMNTKGIINDYPDLEMGYDDKCGIAIILWLFLHRADLKFRAIISSQEEECDKRQGRRTIPGRKGGCGIQYALDNCPEFFKAKWGIILDRAEDKTTEENCNLIKFKDKIRVRKSDIIWRYAGEPLCSLSFIQKMEEISAKCGTPMLRGSSTAKADAMNIKNCEETKNIALVNLATGFYKEHQNDDYVSVFEMIRSLKVAMRCIKLKDELNQFV